MTVAVDARSIPRVPVLGVKVSAISTADAVATVRDWIARGERQYVCVTGVHGVMESHRDSDILRDHNASGLTLPDGVPLYWACLLAGERRVTQSRGMDLFDALCRDAAREGHRLFFFGGAPGVAEDLADLVQEHYPGAQIAGTQSPPFRDLTHDEDAEVVTLINASSADIVFVGLSTPKQERWMAAHRSHLAAPVLVGVGAVFDFATGRQAQAPRLLRGSGLEWMYRLAREPRRLSRRYLRNNPAFAVAAVSAALRRCRHLSRPATTD